MDSINIADLKDELGTLIDGLEAGEAVQITRNGQYFACVTPASSRLPPREPIDFDARRALRATTVNHAGGINSSMTVEEMRRHDLL
ncbi:MAG: type II toxin-antitoxin system prevent-host-death family antitoxin [Pseudomonadota bacterium]|jgi:antitoxin (DNA-binding transcriptional repressor) of toxin-antitoxin stability system